MSKFPGLAATFLVLLTVFASTSAWKFNVVKLNSRIPPAGWFASHWYAAYDQDDSIYLIGEPDGVTRYTISTDSFTKFNGTHHGGLPGLFGSNMAMTSIESGHLSMYYLNQEAGQYESSTIVKLEVTPAEAAFEQQKNVDIVPVKAWSCSLVSDGRDYVYVVGCGRPSIFDDPQIHRISTRTDEVEVIATFPVFSIITDSFFDASTGSLYAFGISSTVQKYNTESGSFGERYRMQVPGTAESDQMVLAQVVWLGGAAQQAVLAYRKLTWGHAEEDWKLFMWNTSHPDRMEPVELVGDAASIKWTYPYPCMVYVDVLQRIYVFGGGGPEGSNVVYIGVSDDKDNEVGVEADTPAHIKILN